jgi:hypothetical protein
MRAAPSASRAKSKAHEQSHHRYTASIRHSLRGGLTLPFVLPGDRPFATVVSAENRALTQTVRAVATYSA